MTFVPIGSFCAGTCFASWLFSLEQFTSTWQKGKLYFKSSGRKMNLGTPDQLHTLPLKPMPGPVILKLQPAIAKAQLNRLIFDPNHWWSREKDRPGRSSHSQPIPKSLADHTKPIEWIKKGLCAWYVLSDWWYLLYEFADQGAALSTVELGTG